VAESLAGGELWDAVPTARDPRFWWQIWWQIRGFRGNRGDANCFYFGNLVIWKVILAFESLSLRHIFIGMGIIVWGGWQA